MTINVHFDEQDWERIERDWSAWWAGDLDRPMVVIETYEPSPGVQLPNAPSYVTNLPPDLPAEEVVDRYQAQFQARRYYGDAWPKWWANFGPGITAGFLGARVRPAPDTVWFEPAERVDIRDLHLAYDEDNFWWRRVREVARVATERWRGQVTVGYPDLGGNLDVLASFRTTGQLLLDVYDAPEEVERLAGEITRLWLRYYDGLWQIIRAGGRGSTPWAPIWSPGRCYMLQCDFSYMLSPSMFERFVLPGLSDCCAALDHAFYHLDGKGEIPHLDMLLSLERLHGIQWIPGDGAPPPDQWLPLLKRIRDGGKRCQVGVTAQGARTIVRELGGRGFVLHVRGLGSGEEAEAFLRVLAEEDAGR
jgi:hypothetical protein